MWNPSDLIEEHFLTLGNTHCFKPTFTWANVQWRSFAKGGFHFFDTDVTTQSLERISSGCYIILYSRSLDSTLQPLLFSTQIHMRAPSFRAHTECESCVCLLMPYRFNLWAHPSSLSLFLGLSDIWGTSSRNGERRTKTSLPPSWRSSLSLANWSICYLSGLYPVECELCNQSVSLSAFKNLKIYSLTLFFSCSCRFFLPSFFFPSSLLQHSRVTICMATLTVWHFHNPGGGRERRSTDLSLSIHRPAIIH